MYLIIEVIMQIHVEPLQLHVIVVFGSLDLLQSWAYLGRLQAGLFCDGTRGYGIPAPFSKARKKLFLMCK